MIGSAESPFICEASPPTMAHFGSHPPCSASLTSDWTMSPAWWGASSDTSSISRTVDVPLGEVGVLGPAGRLMDQPVGAGVLAVDVADHVGGEQRVVERGVEGAHLGRGAATDPDPPEDAVPLARGLRLDMAEGPPGSSTRRLSAALATLTKEMPTFIRTTGSCSVSKVTKAPHALPRHDVVPGRDRRSVPRPGGGEGPVERGVEVQRVVGPGAAELAAGHLAGDPVPARPAWTPESLTGLALSGHLEQDVGLAGAREGEPGEPGPGGHGQLGAHLRRVRG